MANPLPKNVTELQQKPAAAVVYVSPDMAARWLERNTVNRNIRGPKVDQYARDMAGGNWKLTGEAVKFDTAGKLIDGQHRCSAVVQSGCTVPMFVVRGLPADAQTVMDSGSGRTAADNLSMQGHKHATTIAAIARRMMAYTQARDYKLITNSEVYSFVDDHPDIIFAAGIGVRYGRNCDVAPGTLGVAAWLIAERHGWDVTEKFFSTAAEKVGLVHHDPITAMCRFFAEARRNRKQLPIEVQLSVIIRAFNYRRAGKTIQFIRSEVNGNAVPVPAVSA